MDMSTTVFSHVAQGCLQASTPPHDCVLVTTPNGFTTQARALLDSASSTFFVSERLTQHLHLPHSRQLAQITGIGGISHQSLGQSVMHFSIASVWSFGGAFEVEAIVLPKVTSDLPLHPVPLDGKWNHISGIQLADPDFGSPGNIDILLVVNVFSHALLQGWRFGPMGSPSAFETRFGWVLVAQSIVISHRRKSCLTMSQSSLVTICFKSFGR